MQLKNVGPFGGRMKEQKGREKERKERKRKTKKGENKRREGDPGHPFARGDGLIHHQPPWPHFCPEIAVN